MSQQELDATQELSMDDSKDESMQDEVLEQKMENWLKVNGQAAVDNWLNHSEGARASFLLWISKFAQAELDSYMDDNFGPALEAALSLWIQIKSRSVTAAMQPVSKSKFYNAEGEELVISAAPVAVKKRKFL